MPELIMAYSTGMVERHPLTDELAAPWTSEDLETVLSSICSDLARPPDFCRVHVRWLPDGRMTLGVYGPLGSACLGAIPVVTGAVEHALEVLT